MSLDPRLIDAATARFRIAAGLDVVVLSADEVLVQFGSRSHPSELVRDSDLTGILGRAIARLHKGAVAGDMGISASLVTEFADEELDAAALVDGVEDGCLAVVELHAEVRGDNA